MYPGNEGIPQAQDLLVKADAAVQKAKDDVAQADTRRSPGWWPSGATVVRVVIVAIVALVVVGWLLSALNH